MELVYEWINQTEQKKYDGNPILEDFDLNLSHNYEFHYDREKSTLSCRCKTGVDLSDVLLGQGAVKKINCFVGDNGSGKTTILKHLFKTELLDSKEYPF